MKSGLITVAEDGTVGPLVPSTGFGIFTDAAKNVVSLNTAAVGYTAAVKGIFHFLIGNVAGVQSTTGKIGVGVLGKNYVMGG